jgi:hypothetical protein
MYGAWRSPDKTSINLQGNAEFLQGGAGVGGKPQKP